MSNLNEQQFETYYHLTDRKNFKPSARKVPADNALSVRSRKDPGLYVADSVEGWWNGHQYHRPYVAEVRVPKGVAREERWGGERFIDAEHIGKVEVPRVMPTDAWVREKYREPGWVEDQLDSAFDTGEKFERSWGVPTKKFEDYTYDGPDVREFTPEQHKEHVSRLRQYKKAQGR